MAAGERAALCDKCGELVHAECDAVQVAAKEASGCRAGLFHWPGAVGLFNVAELCFVGMGNARYFTAQPRKQSKVGSDTNRWVATTVGGW